MQIYVIERPDGLVKIGRSVSPSPRIHKLAMQGGFELSRAWMSLPGLFSGDAELYAHQELAHRRVVGEWFDIDFDEAVECVEKHSAPIKANVAIDATRKIVANNIRRLRKAHGISQMQLGEQSQAGQTTISSVENPVGKSPTLETLELIADSLEVPQWTLLLNSTMTSAQLKSLDGLLSTYLSLSSQGQEQVHRVIEAEHRYTTTA